MILAAFFDLHHFYLKNNITGVVYVGLAIVYGIGWALSLIDLIVMINMVDAEWNEYLSSEKSIIWL
jgi:TM2 domain-containing membrane protein YozV